MTRNTLALACAAVALLALSACGESATLSVESGIGPDPALPKPKTTLLPTINTADPVGWPAGAAPTAAAGLAAAEFAAGLDHPRWLYVLPNGDVLVAETNGPPRPDESKGVRGFFQTQIMKSAGAATPSTNRITLLRDADGDGRAEFRATFLSGLYSPFGMALVGDVFYVADSDKVLRFQYRAGETTIRAAGVKVADLPAGPRNHHWTKGLIASADGARLYASVGSNSNVAENGLELEVDRAAILAIDPATGARRVHASGLRNPVGMDFEPTTGALWTVVNERDEIGSDLVPDYMTSVRQGGFYGWPYSYYGRTVDERVKPPRPDLVATAIKPDYALGAHTASLGLTFAEGARLGPAFTEGAFVGQHGSWNRKPRSGYKVIFVPFRGGRPSGPPADVLTGFLSPDGKALGRPVGVVVDKGGGLLVADDVGNRIWRVSAVAP